MMEPIYILEYRQIELFPLTSSLLVRVFQIKLHITVKSRNYESKLPLEEMFERIPSSVLPSFLLV